MLRGWLVENYPQPLGVGCPAPPGKRGWRLGEGQVDGLGSAAGPLGGQCGSPHHAASWGDGDGWGVVVGERKEGLMREDGREGGGEDCSQGYL